ncbi:hypothetical protein [Muricoccus aerilatus]|uniref:hypothetical protein n=1 Tax=Muricoccus aerilatus TaxID=452982 RepID=UPI0005C1EB8F|nr:hypothetical protein [Roseomonas aerilata]
MASYLVVDCWAVAFGLALGSAQAQQQHHDHNHGGAPPSPAALGSLQVPVSCTPEAQAAFDDAMKLQHSFCYQAADQAHRRVLECDPVCVMGDWGRALALLRNPFSPPPPNALPQGRALLEQAQRISAKTEREAGFIGALTFLFAGDDMPGHRARMVQYAQAMEALSGRFHDDAEVAVTHALSLDQMSV